MSLPVPNLDDRSWKQIVDEAVRLIPRYCPEWTNHNASDPGVTLLELYAWMTEMVIYRLNKVPEKNFLTFLDLIGVRLKPPEPARVVLEFTPADGIPVAAIDEAAVTARADSDGRIVLLGAIDAVEKIIVGGHVIKLRRWLVSLRGPIFSAVNTDRRAAIIAVDHALRILRVDP